MLLESIKLENFRQFRDGYIEFAEGKQGKNVTIIIGENGTGKTTFAQAFFWCLYGTTSFNQDLLNKHVAEKMTPSETAEVRVILKLKHGDIDYTLTRRQTFHKDLNNRIKGDNSVFDIGKKLNTGITEFVNPSHCEAEVNGILPKALSGYFFFDGERIENMSKDITSGSRSSDFAEAVNGLLGLNAIMSAIKHLKKGGSASVISSYNRSFDATSNQKVQEYTEEINDCDEKLKAIDKELDTISDQKTKAEERRKEKIIEIKQYEEGEKLQNKKEEIERDIEDYNKLISDIYKEMCKDYNHSMSSFFSLSLIYRALTLLSQHKFTGKDIPSITAKTVNYLLGQGTCICGTHLDKGSLAYETVKSLLDVIPPKSLSTYIHDFKEESKRRTDTYVNLVEVLAERLAKASEYSDRITDRNQELHDLEEKIKGGNVKNKVRDINEQIRYYENIIQDCNRKREDALKRQGALEQKRNSADKQRQTLSLLDEKNKKTQVYLTYATQIYDELESTYKISENDVRNRLQNTINDIFNQIYNGGLSLTIDEKYHIKVHSNMYNDIVETSTAQSIAVIFAFITGIIKMAKENRTSTNLDEQLLSSESYPLVMDAPLSAFDKRRIKSVCETIPTIADQVIIFIKDTDGDLAKGYMGNRIGSEHTFNKKDEFETELI